MSRLPGGIEAIWILSRIERPVHGAVLIREPPHSCLTKAGSSGENADMPARISSSLQRPGLLLTLLAHVRLAIRLLREPGVPVWSKLVPVLAALYLAWPLDIVPDFLPVLGQLDDLGIVLMALEGFLRLCPPAAVAFHRAGIAAGRRFSRMPVAADVIDAEWRRE